MMKILIDEMKFEMGWHECCAAGSYLCLGGFIGAEDPETHKQQGHKRTPELRDVRGHGVAALAVLLARGLAPEGQLHELLQ